MKTISFLRREQYKRLSKLTIDGKILDVGGSYKSGYHELINGTHTFTVGNIDASYGADVIFDAQERWPFDDSSQNAVLFINVLEHLYRPQNALTEAHRVLATGGSIVGVVPFMFNVHGSPHDFFRYTKTTLETMLKEYGFDYVHVEVLGTGAFSVIYHCLLGFVRFRALATPLIFIARSLDWIVAKIKPDNKMTAEYMPLGYYFEARSAAK